MGKVGIVHADEMRLGLISMIRRRWGERGQRVIQRMQRVYRWQYLYLGVDVETGRLWWAWGERLDGATTAQVLSAWKARGVRGVIWDRAGGHRSRVVQSIDLPRAYLPPYSPELNPAERIFQEVRRQVEGLRYDSLEAKRAAVEAFLAELARDTERVRRLVGYPWIKAAYANAHER